MPGNSHAGDEPQPRRDNSRKERDYYKVRRLASSPRGMLPEFVDHIDESREGRITRSADVHLHRKVKVLIMAKMVACPDRHYRQFAGSVGL